MRDKVFNSHAVIGYSGNMMLVMDYNTGGEREDICRMKFLNKNTGEEITRFYLNRDSIDELVDVLREVK